MKIARFFGWIFGLAGAALMAAAIGLCFLSLNAEPRVEGLPGEAEACSEALMERIAAGDFAGASELLYGEPDLGAEGRPEDAFGILVWTAWLDSLSYSFQGPCYIEGAEIRRDVTVSALDISSVTKNLKTYAHAFMTHRVESATEMSQLYDESGQFRQELINAVVSDALDQALREDAKTLDVDVQLTLIREEGRWWAVPSQGLWKALSGNLA